MLRAVLVLVLRLALAAYLLLLDLESAVKELPAAPPLAGRHITAGKAAAVVVGQQTSRLALLVAVRFGVAGAAVLVDIVAQHPQLS
jgi:hypothetical protein